MVIVSLKSVPARSPALRDEGRARKRGDLVAGSNTLGKGGGVRRAMTR